MDRAAIISPGPFPSICSPSPSTVPASANKTKKARLSQYLRERKLTRVTEREWRELLAMLSPVSESYLRRLLAEMEIPVEPPFGGVRQKTFEELERSLLCLKLLIILVVCTNAVRLSMAENYQYSEEYQ